MLPGAPGASSSQASRSIFRTKADAASHRTPPVQYMSTSRPRNLSTCADSHAGSSENCRMLGKSVVTPMCAGSSKRPSRHSYSFRTSSSTGGCCPRDMGSTAASDLLSRQWEGDTATAAWLQRDVSEHSTLC
eukprot:scaffold305727_cov31-Tisochrysis_lutea.AAC.2